MESFLIGIIIFSAILFFLSFFLPNRTKELKDEIEQLSIKLYQENYQIKKRLSLLEEELLMANDLPKRNEKPDFHPIIVNQVRLLHKDGVPVEKIAKQAALTEDEVYGILDSTDRGV
ncbi:hypothetical protein [Fervidibacillus halotolerans]|uniref:Uncharacterized protein n=1 Tax=Fervidibacillus halotolerans TaxID=2980027 RepID=A0A9E8LXD6_9BACI|nr:hypothetical protein [Fervidibacillus halotolerans]WAA11468.1 hypothetical protein OE105_07425 [Fervidibacillus halotolerans]